MKKRHTPELIVRKPHEAEAKLATGASVPQVATELGISEATFHRWKNRYGDKISFSRASLPQNPSNSATFCSRASPSESGFSVKAASPRASYSRLHFRSTLCARLCFRQICAGRFSPMAICRTHSSLNSLECFLLNLFSFIRIELYIRFVEKLTYEVLR